MMIESHREIEVVDAQNVAGMVYVHIAQRDGLLFIKVNPIDINFFL